MDYVFGRRERKKTLISGFERILTERRRQFQDWEAKPPHKWGWVIFGLVVVELVLAKRLFHEIGMGVSIIHEIIRSAIGLLIIEGVLVKITDAIADYYNKKGNWKATFTFLNISLFPMLLFLPMSLLLWVGAGSPFLRVVLYGLLVLYVLSNWKESIEISHELSKFQSAFVLYATIGIFFSLIIFGSYLSFLSFVTDLSSILQ